MRNGRTYRVIERKYLLFPQHSGQIRLDGPVLDAQVPDDRGGTNPFGANSFFGNVFGRNPFAGMMNATRPCGCAATRWCSTCVRVPPADRPRLAAGAKGDAGRKPGSRTTRPHPRRATPSPGTCTSAPLGLTASQLPDLSVLMPLPDGLRAYPDQAKLNTGVQGDGVVGTRDQDIALIASRCRPLSNSRAPSVLVGHHPQPAARSRIAGAHPVCPAQCRRGRRRDHAPGPGWRHAAIAG